MHGGEAFVFTVMFAGFFAMVFGVVYLRTRQNMAMIEKGMNPKEFINRPAPYRNLKWALLLIGAGAGLFLAYILDNHVLSHEYFTETYGQNTYRRRMDDDGTPAIYFALIAIGGGLGLLGSYKMEKKWWDDNKPGKQD
jgi:hypothetical protein